MLTNKGSGPTIQHFFSQAHLPDIRNTYILKNYESMNLKLLLVKFIESK